MQIQVFRTGTHTDAAGNERTWTEQDLDAIVARYQPGEHEAPVVLGHPKDNAPAYGWVERMWREGAVLFAQLKDLAPEFTEWVKAGRYKKRSISLYPDMSLKHIGFLGAMPPAIKGLADVQFSEHEAVTMEFSDYRIGSIGRIMQRMREFIIEKFGVDAADKVVGNYEIEDLQREIPEFPAAASSLFNEPNAPKEDAVNKELEDKLKAEQGKSAEFAEQLKKEQTEKDELKRQLDAANAAGRKAEHRAFCEGLQKEGKISPAMLPAVMDFMEVLHGAGEFEFAEGDKTVKAQPIDRFKAYLAGLPKVLEFSEVATKTAAVSGTDAAGRRQQLETEFAEKNPGMTYKDVVLSLSKEHPELYKEDR